MKENENRGRPYNEARYDDFGHFPKIDKSEYALKNGELPGEIAHFLPTT